MIPKIDAHIHYFLDHPDSEAMLDRAGVETLFNIAVANGPEATWRGHSECYRQLAHAHPKRFAWCTTFDPFRYAEPDFAERAIAEIAADLDDNALGCKIWKNVGMEIRKPDGRFLMADDPVFDPIYRYLEERGVTLMAHLGEPRACWRPLDEPSPDQAYYQAYPEWHMYGRDDMPGHGEIMAARDRMLAKFPGLKVVGAHLGSLEYDVRELAKRFDAYPNFYADSSARMVNMSWQDSGVVRAFMERYQDRLIWGTDLVIRMTVDELTEDDLRASIKKAADRYELEARYFETSGPMEACGRTVQALNLPGSILDKFYRTNAIAAYPGLG